MPVAVGLQAPKALEVGLAHCCGDGGRARESPPVTFLPAPRFAASLMTLAAVAGLKSPVAYLFNIWPPLLAPATQEPTLYVHNKQLLAVRVTTWRVPPPQPRLGDSCRPAAATETLDGDDVDLSVAAASLWFSGVFGQHPRAAAASQGGVSWVNRGGKISFLFGYRRDRVEVRARFGARPAGGSLTASTLGTR